MRSFLRGDSKPFQSKTELKKYISVPSFSAPKRPYAKSFYSKRPESKKHPNENLHATINLVRASSTFLEEHSLEYQKPRESEVLKEVGFLDNLARSLEIPTEPDIPAKMIESIKPLGSGSKQILGSGSRENSALGFSGLQKMNVNQDDDDMLISLVEEVNRLNECLLERITENEKLKKENMSLESKLLDVSTRNKKEYMDNTISDIKGKTDTYASLESEEDQRVLEETIKRTPVAFASKGMTKWKSCMKPSFNETTKCSNCALAEQLLRKNMKQDKEKLDELSLSLDNLQNNLLQKEESNYNLMKELEAMKKNSEGSSQQLVQQQQLTEKLRTELRNAHAHNQELSNKIAALKADANHQSLGSTVSFTRIESSKPNFSSHEVSEWEKKYEFARNDNERLIKIVSENQKVIQNFKNILADMEQRHNVRYEELKKDYEDRFRGLSHVKSDPKFYSNNRNSFHSNGRTSSNEPMRYPNTNTNNVLEITKVNSAGIGIGGGGSLSKQSHLG